MWFGVWGRGYNLYTALTIDFLLQSQAKPSTCFSSAFSAALELEHGQPIKAMSLKSDRPSS